MQPAAGSDQNSQGSSPPAGASPPTPPPSPPAAPPSPPAPPAPPVGATRPEYLPENFWDATKNAPKADELKKLFDGHTARQANLIDDPAKLELKTDLKDLKGNPVTFNMEDPMLKGFVAMAKERGWTKDDVNGVAELVLQAQLASTEAEHREFLSIGGGDEARADARYKAVIERGAAVLGQDGVASDATRKAVAGLIASISTKAQFEVLEKLIGADPAAAPAGGNGAKVTNIAESWYGKDGLSGIKKAG